MSGSGRPLDLNYDFFDETSSNADYVTMHIYEAYGPSILVLDREGEVVATVAADYFDGEIRVMVWPQDADQEDDPPHVIPLVWDLARVVKKARRPVSGEQERDEEHNHEDQQPLL